MASVLSYPAPPKPLQKALTCPSTADTEEPARGVLKGSGPEKTRLVAWVRGLSACPCGSSLGDLGVGEQKTKRPLLPRRRDVPAKLADQ